MSYHAEPLGRSAAEPTTPTRLGRYELIGQLATGGMAEIHLARLAGEAGFEKTVVVKRLLPELVASKAFVAMFLGRKLEYVYEIVEHVPGERLVMQSGGKPFPMRTTYTWEPVGDGQTRMTLRNSGQPSGFAAIGAKAMARAMRSATTKDLARLKALLESR